MIYSLATSVVTWESIVQSVYTWGKELLTVTKQEMDTQTDHSISKCRELEWSINGAEQAWQTEEEKDFKDWKEK